MIFSGLLPWNTYSANLKRGALMASCCVLCEILTPNNMDYHKIAGSPPDPKYVSIDSDFSINSVSILYNKCPWSNSRGIF